MNKTQGSRTPRETEPLPKTVKPALLFLLFLAGVVATMAIAAYACLLYTSPSPRDRTRSRMPSSA